VSDTDSRFKEYGRIEDPRDNSIQDIAVSAKFTDETHSQLDGIAVQPFVDDETPHGRMGNQFPPEVWEAIVNRVEIALMKETDLL